jgi:signal transduction histidine kinase
VAQRPCVTADVGVRHCAARLRETATEIAVEHERNRIARELHDVLAHSLTVIVAQADGIRFIHRTEPESVEEASTVIAESAGTALVETRRLIEGIFIAPALTNELLRLHHALRR